MEGDEVGFGLLGVGLGGGGPDIIKFSLRCLAAREGEEQNESEKSGEYDVREPRTERRIRFALRWILYRNHSHFIWGDILQAGGGRGQRSNCP